MSNQLLKNTAGFPQLLVATCLESTQLPALLSSGLGTPCPHALRPDPCLRLPASAAPAPRCPPGCLSPPLPPFPPQLCSGSHFKVSHAPRKASYFLLAPLQPPWHWSSQSRYQKSPACNVRLCARQEPYPPADTCLTQKCPLIWILR